jgi:hypothetical protein
MGFKNFNIPDINLSKQKKNFIQPATLEIGKAGAKNFFIDTDLLVATASNALRKIGFIPPFGLEYFDDLPIGISAFGLPIFDNISFPGGQYSVVNADQVQQIISYEPVQIDTVIVEASMRKNIVSTQVAGRDGAVKEYISSNDTIISISGAIVNTNSNAYPRQEVIDLVRLLKVPQQLIVRSKFINDILGFEHITIESWRLNTTRGHRNTQLFSIEAINDISPSADETTADVTV